MGLDKKEQKKVEKIIHKIFFNINEIEKIKAQLLTEENDKQIKKLNEKIKIRTGIITDYSKEFAELGLSLETYSQQLNENQRALLSEIFPYGFNKESIETQKRRNEIINKYKGWIKKLKKLREEYPPYDPDLTVKEKLKNKIYKQEKDIGWYMMADSDPNTKCYEPEWNYKEHFATSTEFTQEERDIIEHCIKVGEEYDAYFDERYGFIAEIGESLCNKGEAIKEWGSITQARVWARNQVNDTMPEVVKYLNPDHTFNDEELEYESRELFKRFLSFIADKENLGEYLEIRDMIEKEGLDEVNKLRETSRRATAETKGILRKTVMGHIEKKIDRYASAAEAQLMLEYLMEAIGAEKGMFMYLYTSSEEAMQGTDELIKYTFEELGLE